MTIHGTSVVRSAAVAGVLSLMLGMASFAAPAVGGDAQGVLALDDPDGWQGAPVTVGQAASEFARETRQQNRDSLADGQLAAQPDERPDWAPSMPKRAAIPADQALVEVLHSMSDNDAKAVVETAGGTVTGGVRGSLVEAIMPRSRLVELQTTSGVDHVRAAKIANVPMALTEGSNGEEAILKSNADAWHDAGIRGAGVKVGIVDAFDDALWDAAQAVGELPAPAGTFCRWGGAACDLWTSSSAHGQGVAEIVHDMAPDAEIYLAVAGTTADLQAAVDWFAAQGVTVVNRSMSSYLDGPGDGTGPLDSVAASATSQGITFVQAAGNHAGEVGERLGGHRRSSWADGNSNGWLEFVPGDEILGFSCGFSEGLRWQDWGLDPTDYDVFIWDTIDDAVSGEDPERWSVNDQSAGAEPLEWWDCDGYDDVDYMGIALYDAGNGAAGDTLQLFVGNGALEHWSNPYSATVGIADSASPGVLTVGAIDPAFGVTIAPYSSRGPTNDGRVKPDLSAASCISSFTYGPDCFDGTSAAAPVAAGAAALRKQAAPSSNPTDLAGWLRSETTERGATGPDTTYGDGEIQLPHLLVGDYNPVSPERYADTRPGQSTVDGVGAGTGAVLAGTVLEVDVTERGAALVPDSASAVSLNVTVVGPSAQGYLTVYPCGASRPHASNLNYVAGQTVPNAVLTKVGAGGAVCLYAGATTHVVVDLNGWFPAGADFTSMSPERYADTRPGQSTVDGVGAGTGAVLAGTVLEVDVTERGAALVPDYGWRGVPERHRGGAVGSGLPDRLSVRGIASARVEPELRGWPDCPERGADQGRRRWRGVPLRWRHDARRRRPQRLVPRWGRFHVDEPGALRGYAAGSVDCGRCRCRHGCGSGRDCA